MITPAQYQEDYIIEKLSGNLISEYESQNCILMNTRTPGAPLCPKTKQDYKDMGIDVDDQSEPKTLGRLLRAVLAKQHDELNRVESFETWRERMSQPE